MCVDASPDVLEALGQHRKHRFTVDGTWENGGWVLQRLREELCLISE